MVAMGSWKTGSARGGEGGAQPQGIAFLFFERPLSCDLAHSSVGVEEAHGLEPATRMGAGTRATAGEGLDDVIPLPLSLPGGGNGGRGGGGRGFTNGGGAHGMHRPVVMVVHRAGWRRGDEISVGDGVGSGCGAGENLVRANSRVE